MSWLDNLLFVLCCMAIIAVLAELAYMIHKTEKL